MGDNGAAATGAAGSVAGAFRLSPDVVRQIEDSLRRAGPFGEVRLVLVKGKLRFIKVVCSECLGEGATEPGRP